MEQEKHLILSIAQALVEFPDEVSVKKIGRGGTIVFELTVAWSDTGKVIGKQGRTADAIRTILNAIAGKTRKRMILEIVDQR